MEQLLQTKQETISSILWGKFLRNIRNTSLKEYFSITCSIVATGGLTILFLRPDLLITSGVFLYSSGNYLLPKLLLSALIVFKGPKVYRWIRKRNRVMSGMTLESIPISELLDHLFTEQSFKREEIKKKFGLAHHRYNILAQKLEDLKVLNRGPNNSRVLNTEYSRQDIAGILEGKKKAEDLSEELRRVSSTQLTLGPTKDSIEQRVEELLSSPSALFPLKAIK